MELDQKYLLALDPDRLLHMFRINAGLPSSARPLGGWEAQRWRFAVTSPDIIYLHVP